MDNRHLFLSAGSLLLAGTAPAARPAKPNFINDTATTEIYTNLNTLSLHDALPIWHDEEEEPLYDKEKEGR